jgi:preprotein translocase subunit YajC
VWLSVVLFAVMIGAFYLLLWRPQQRRMAAIRELQSRLEVGDQVMTTAGIHGRIVALADETVELEIAPSTVVRIARGAIAQHLGAPPGRVSGDAGADDEETD